MESFSTSQPQNILKPEPSPLAEELATTLVQSPDVRIERIVSEGQRSPDGFWYDQDENEWVVVLKGRAALEFEGEPELVELTVGCCQNIPAHRRHRVAWTSPDEQTVWLAVFYKG